MNSTSREQSFENARERLRLAQALFGELTLSCLNYQVLLEMLLSQSSPGLPGEPSSQSAESPSP